MFLPMSDPYSIRILPPLLPGVSAHSSLLWGITVVWSREGAPAVYPQQAKLVLLECHLDLVALMLRISSVRPFLSEQNPKLILAMPCGINPATFTLTYYSPPYFLGSSHTGFFVLHTYRVHSCLRAFALTDIPAHFLSYPCGRHLQVTFSVALSPFVQTTISPPPAFLILFTLLYFPLQLT